MNHAFVVLEHVMTEGRILKIAQDWSTFAVSEVSDETPLFFQALLEMPHI